MPGSLLIVYWRGLGWRRQQPTRRDYCPTLHCLLATYYTTPYQCSLSGLARNGSRYTLDLDTELHTINNPPT